MPVMHNETGYTVGDPGDLAERYIALWNEPDPGVRRKLIQDVWAPGGAQILEPPEAVRDAATSLAFEAPPLEAHGHEALEARVTRAYEMFIAPGEFVFRARGTASRLHDVVSFAWEMAPAAGGDAVGGGRDVFVLDDAGRIRIDYQFIGL